MEETFQDQKKVRHAELLTPPNRLKEKVGTGGIDETVLKKAQTLIETNTVDFKPIATLLLEQLNKTTVEARTGATTGETAIEAIIYPAMQLKSQGSMFHYPLVTDFSDILVNFLETVESVDQEMLNIVDAHRLSMSIVLSGQITSNNDPAAKDLRTALIDACSRYYKLRKI